MPLFISFVYVCSTCSNAHDTESQQPHVAAKEKQCRRQQCQEVLKLQQARKKQAAVVSERKLTLKEYLSSNRN